MRSKHGQHIGKLLELRSRVREFLALPFQIHRFVRAQLAFRVFPLLLFAAARLLTMDLQLRCFLFRSSLLRSCCFSRICCLFCIDSLPACQQRCWLVPTSDARTLLCEPLLLLLLLRRHEGCLAGMLPSPPPPPVVLLSGPVAHALRLMRYRLLLLQHGTLEVVRRLRGRWTWLLAAALLII